MPLTAAVRQSFLARFDPRDLSHLAPADTEALLDWLCTAPLLAYQSADSALVIPLQAACMLRILENKQRRSWRDRITALEFDIDNALEIVAMGSSVPPERLHEAWRARRIAIDAHRLLGWRTGRSYGMLRRDRKRAWRTFMRITSVAVRGGLRAYAVVICSRSSSGRPQ